MLFQIHQDAAVDAAFAEREIIHAEHTRRAHCWCGRAPNQPQEGITARGEGQLARRPCPSATA